MTPTSKKVPDKEKPSSQLSRSVSKSNWLSKPTKSLAERFMSPKMSKKTVEQSNVSKDFERDHKSKNRATDESVERRNKAKNSEIRALQQSTMGHRNKTFSEKTIESSNSSSFESNKSKDRASEKSLERHNTSKSEKGTLELTEEHRNGNSAKTTERIRIRDSSSIFRSSSKESRSAERSVERRNESKTEGHRKRVSEKTTKRKDNYDGYFGSKSKSKSSEESVDRRNRAKRKKSSTSCNNNNKSPKSKKNKGPSSSSSSISSSNNTDKKLKNKNVYSTTEEILAEMKEIEEYQKDIENLENLLNTKLPTYVDSPVKKFTGPLLDCKDLPLEEITEYFDINIQYLTDIVSGKRYSKKHEMFYSSSSDQLIADTSVLMVYTYEQINHMANLMSKYFDSNDSKTIYFFKVLIPIFGLKIFAKEHKMSQRKTIEYLNNRPFDDNN